MKTIMKVKMSIDLIMTILLLFLMGYQFWGDFAHEWAGAAMLVLFIVHHILNRNWYKNLFKGKYSFVRTIQLLVNFVLLAIMLGMMVSGMVLSRHVFAFLPIEGGASWARILHMVCAYWGFVLMAFHLGLHWNMVLGMAGKIKKGTFPGGKVGAFVLSTAIAVYGIMVFVRRGLADYMLLKTQFVFLDFEESKIYYYGEYLAMMGFFVYVAYYIMKIIRKIGNKRKQKEIPENM